MQPTKVATRAKTVNIMMCGMDQTNQMATAVPIIMMATASRIWGRSARSMVTVLFQVRAMAEIMRP